MNENARGDEVASDVAPNTWVDPESVVLVLQGTSPSDHPGIVDGYERLRAAGLVKDLAVFPVFGPQGVTRGEAFWRDLVATAYDISATLLVFQYYHSKQLPDPAKWIHQLRELPSAPMILATLGDPFMNGYFGGPSIPRSFLAAAAVSDLVAMTSMGSLASHVGRFTNAPLMLMPNGACQVRFGRPMSGEAASGIDREFDVAFVGSRNRSRNPGRGNFWLSRRRVRLVEELTKRYGRRFAVFGSGWDHLPSAQGPVPFDAQVAAVRRARIVVGGVPFSRARYYTSNRPFIQATSGVPIVDVAVPGVDRLLRDREHWLLSSEPMLVSRVDDALRMSDTELSRIGSSAAQYVSERHTQAQRVSALVENVRRLRRLRGGGDQEPPYLPYFLDEVDTGREARSATRAWPGVAQPA